ncbi:MAG: hypothetical protein AAF629_32765 [Chloroflexota bacterium]
MKRRRHVIAWRAIFIFYVVLLVVITIIDAANGVLTLSYWGTQVSLVSLGVALLVLVGWWFPHLSAQRGVLLTFSVGVLTIIPGVLMSLNPPGDFWTQYFNIGLSMAAGSFLGFLFINLFSKLPKE